VLHASAFAARFLYGIWHERYGKLGVKTRAEATAMALRSGLPGT
jgi:hypothetical protein